MEELKSVASVAEFGPWSVLSVYSQPRERQGTHGGKQKQLMCCLSTSGRPNGRLDVRVFRVFLHVTLWSDTGPVWSLFQSPGGARHFIVGELNFKLTESACEARGSTAAASPKRLSYFPFRMHCALCGRKGLGRASGSSTVPGWW